MVLTKFPTLSFTGLLLMVPYRLAGQPLLKTVDSHIFMGHHVHRCMQCMAELSHLIITCWKQLKNYSSLGAESVPIQSNLTII